MSANSRAKAQQKNSAATMVFHVCPGIFSVFTPQFSADLPHCREIIHCASRFPTPEIATMLSISTKNIIAPNTDFAC